MIGHHQFLNDGCTPPAGDTPLCARGRGGGVRPAEQPRDRAWGLGRQVLLGGDETSAAFPMHPLLGWGDKSFSEPQSEVLVQPTPAACARVHD
jgi:hypothetical protein